MSSNQFAAHPKSDHTKCSFGTVFFLPKGFNVPGNIKAMLIRLRVDSDGPQTAPPDDLMVVRKLLEELAAGVKPNFTINSDGSYEFNAAGN